MATSMFHVKMLLSSRFASLRVHLHSNVQQFHKLRYFTTKFQYNDTLQLNDNSSNQFGIRYFSHSMSGGNQDDGEHGGSKAKHPPTPGAAIRAKKEARATKQEPTKSSTRDEGLDQDVVSAVEKVAKSLPQKEQNKTRSDLLQKLQQHSTGSEKAASADISSLFSGMRIEKDSRTSARSSRPRPHLAPNGDSENAGGPGRRHQHIQKQSITETMLSGSRPPRSIRNETASSVKLFEGPALGIFSRKAVRRPSEPTPATLFDKLEREECEKQMSMPPRNAFEEMMHWTKEGKLWKFPIDNEQGLDDEAKVGFHEHIFIEQLIDNRFPAHGPIRHFMELVAAGLSKNPFISAAEKREHVAWYAEYFKDKYHLIESSQSHAAAAPADSSASSVSS